MTGFQLFAKRRQRLEKYDCRDTCANRSRSWSICGLVPCSLYFLQPKSWHRSHKQCDDAKTVTFLCISWNPFLTPTHRAACNVPSYTRWFISCSDKVAHVRNYYSPV